MRVKRILASVFAIVILLGACVGVAVGYNGLSRQIDELTKQVETLTTENKNLTDKTTELEEENKNLTENGIKRTAVDFFYRRKNYQANFRY